MLLCRSRQTIEKEYFKEWERTTALAENYEGRQRTALSTLASLPLVVKYYIVPGPVRFLWFWIWQALLAVAQQIRKRLILLGKSGLWCCARSAASSIPNG